MSVSVLLMVLFGVNIFGRSHRRLGHTQLCSGASPGSVLRSHYRVRRLYEVMENDAFKTRILTSILSFQPFIHYF